MRPLEARSASLYGTAFCCSLHLGRTPAAYSGGEWWRSDLKVINKRQLAGRSHALPTRPSCTHSRSRRWRRLWLLCLYCCIVVRCLTETLFHRVSVGVGQSATCTAGRWGVGTRRPLGPGKTTTVLLDVTPHLKPHTHKDVCEGLRFHELDLSMAPGTHRSRMSQNTITMQRCTSGWCMGVLNV